MEKERGIEYFRTLGQLLQSEPAKEARQSFLATEKATDEYKNAFAALAPIREISQAKRSAIRPQPIVKKTDTGDINHSQKKIFYSSTEDGDPVFSSTYGYERFLDLEVFDKEVQALTTRHRTTRERLRTVNRLVFSPQEGQQYIAASEKGDEASTISQEITEKTAHKETQGTLTVPELLSFQLIRTGLAIIVDQTIDEQVAIARKSGQSAKVAELLMLDRFISCGSLYSKVGEFSIKNFMDPNVFATTELPTIFNFFVDNMVLRENGNFDDILSTNTDPLSREFPNTTKSTANQASAAAWALIDAPDDLLDDFIRTNTGVAKEAAIISKGLIQRAVQVRERVFAALTDPNSKDFPGIKNSFLNYFKSGQFPSLMSLHIGGLKNTENVYNLYRRAQQFIGEGTEVELYSTLSYLVENLAQVSSSGFIITRDDVDTIVDPETVLAPSAETETLLSLGKTISGIFSRSSVKHYEVDPSNITWHGLVPPQSITVDFDPSKPREFSEEFTYVSDTGEDLIFYANLNTGKNTMRWNVLDLPSNLVELRDATIVATKAILDDIQRQAEERYQQRKLSQITAPAVSTITKEKPERVTDEVYLLRKQLREKVRQNPANPIEQALSQIKETERVKNTIGIPNENELVKLMKGISSPDQSIVLKGINSFNQQGIGKFQKLRALGPNGEPLYALRVNTSVRGGVRVLAQENVNQQNGERSFTIVDIGYRKDIYRRNELE